MTNIYNLIVEATRKCNMSCSHCCRGNAQNKSLDINKLQSFLRGIDYVSTLTIGGGEPTLVMDVLKEIKQVLCWSDTTIGSIYIVTNGKKNVLPLAEWFLDMRNIMDDNELSSLGFSFDHWHNENMYNKRDYRKQHFYDVEELFMAHGIEESVRKHSDEKWTYSNLIKMGRSLYSGHREIKPELLEIEDYDDNKTISEGEVYFTFDGEIYSNCNLSYKEMNTKSGFYIGNYTDNLIDKVEEYNKKVEELEFAI